MKLIVAGHGRHGKDTVCNLLKDKGMTFSSSSEFCNELFIYEALKDKYGYKNPEECFEDRHNHRAEWHDLICEYNKEDPARLARSIFGSYDIYAGIRSPEEFYAAKKEGLFNYSIWVDASERLPVEGEDSNRLTKEDCDYVLDNNGPEDRLERNLDLLIIQIQKDIEEEIAHRNAAISSTRRSIREAIIYAILPKSKTLSAAKMKKVSEQFDKLENLSIANANTTVEYITHIMPQMEEKIEVMEKLLLFLDDKYFIDEDPSKLTKKEILDKSNYFSLANLIDKELTESDKSDNTFDKNAEMDDEAAQAFESLSS